MALHCTGEMAENLAVLEACPPLTDRALERLAAARAATALASQGREDDPGALAARRDALLRDAA